MRDGTSAYRTVAALFACLGAAALASSADAASAGPGAGVGGRGVSAPVISHAPTVSHAPGGRSFRHHRGFAGGTYWPGAYAYGPSDQPVAAETPPASNDVHYNYTYDVPWDWAHRYPPDVAPSDHPYVSNCPMQTVVVPDRGGSEHTVTITRCY